MGCLFICIVACVLLTPVCPILCSNVGGLLLGLASSVRYGGRSVSAYVSWVVPVPVVNAAAPVVLVLSLHVGVLLVFSVGIHRHSLNAPL